MKSFSELPTHRELRRLWKQEPLDRPTANLELTPDSWVERGAEVLGWSLARFEYWLSASGWLRAWLRLNLLVSIVLTSAGVLLLPPVAQILEQGAKSSHWFAEIFGDVVGMLTGLPPVVISLGVLYLAFVVYRRIRRKRLASRGYGHEDAWQ
ncbi:MAG: hypothetical protein KDN05_16005 [Verrucomicrobiae bacterium]|nr:hypothetical protein [Verrucomicrobiae bacterium]